jgi:hypothetical protein
VRAEVVVGAVIPSEGDGGGCGESAVQARWGAAKVWPSRRRPMSLLAHMSISSLGLYRTYRRDW